MKENDWLGIRPPQEAIIHSNSKRGYYANANHKDVADGYTREQGVSVTPGARQDRIAEMLDELIASGKKVTQEDFVTMQLDKTDRWAQKGVHFIARVLKQNKDKFKSLVEKHAEKEN